MDSPGRGTTRGHHPGANRRGAEKRTPRVGAIFKIFNWFTERADLPTKKGSGGLPLYRESTLLLLNWAKFGRGLREGPLREGAVYQQVQKEFKI